MGVSKEMRDKVGAGVAVGSQVAPNVLLGRGFLACLKEVEAYVMGGRKWRTGEEERGRSRRREHAGIDSEKSNRRAQISAKSPEYTIMENCDPIERIVSW